MTTDCAQVNFVSVHQCARHVACKMIISILKGSILNYMTEMVLDVITGMSVTTRYSINQCRLVQIQSVGGDTV